MIIEPLVLHHDRKTTLPGLREAFSALPPPPPALSFADFSALPTGDRAAYDQARDDFLRLTLRVPTPEQDLSATILTKLISTNPRRKNSRRGLMISAPMFYGKTELALLLARSVELEHRKRNPEYAARGEVPVVWVEMTDHATGKALLAQIIRFLAPTALLPSRITTEDLRRRAVDMLQIHRTKLIVIDEAHNLAGSEPSSVIKALQNESSATVALVGINLVNGNAFGRGEGLQVTMRCDLVELKKADRTDKGFASWTRLVTSFDRHLPLCEHSPGVLTRNARALFEAADGRLAVLAQIVERLVASILDDPGRADERVTRERLFAVLAMLRETAHAKHKVALDDLVGAT